MLKENYKRNFMEFFLDPQLLTNNEAEEALREKGIDIDMLEKKAADFLKKMKAELALAKGRVRKQKFLNTLEEFAAIQRSIVFDEREESLQFMYKKKPENEIGEPQDEIDDVKLFKYLKESKKGNEKK